MKTNTLTTKGIRIAVETFYQPSYSRPMLGKYFFAYRISIENQNDYPVQLLRRYWEITDAFGGTREVEGEGVVGEQPLLDAQQIHEYVSGCPLNTPLGKMQGYYVMMNMITKATFKVRVPLFKMSAPVKLN